MVADRRAARTSRHARPQALGFAEWLAGRQRQPDLHAERARAGPLAERRVAEALRAWATDGHLVDDQHPLNPPAQPADRSHRPLCEDRHPDRDER